MDAVHAEEQAAKEVILCIERLNKSVTKLDALNKVFSTIVNRKNVQLTLITVLHILKHNLKIDIGMFLKEDAHLCMPLIKCVVYYISSWPGWGKSKGYYTNHISYKQWYKEFQDYLNEKIHHIYANYDKYLTEEPNENEASASVNDKLFQLQLTGPSDNFTYKLSKDDLIIENKNGSSKVLEFCSLLNMPYMSVEVKLPNLHISRKCVHEIKRYITKTKPNVVDKLSETTGFAEVAPIDSTNNEEMVCKFSNLKTCFNNILTQFEMREICSSNLEAIFSLFLEDLHNCMTVNSVLPVNLYFTYNIGNKSYINTISKIDKDKNCTLYVVEEITPKIQFGLHRIDVNDLACDFLKAKGNNIVLENCFLLSCTSCNVQWVGNSFKNAAILHYTQIHPFEGRIECDKCKMNETYYNLSKLRWTHKCS